MSMNDRCPAVSNRTRSAWMIVALVVGFSARLLAGDALNQIPRDVAAVIVFPDLAQTTQRLNTYLESAFPKAQRFSPEDALESFDLPRGVIDYSLPVVIVATRPSFAEESVALVFHPKDLESLAPRGPGPDGVVKTVEEHGHKRFLLMRQGTAFVADRRLALRKFRTASKPPSRLLQSLDKTQLGLIKGSDVFVYFLAPAWRERVRPFVSLGLNAMKLGMMETAGSDDSVTPDEARVMADWAGERVMQVVDEMQTLSASVRFDGKTLELAHHHTFTRNGSVTDYLKDVKLTGLDFGKVIADRRFMAMLALDWQVSAGNSLNCRIMDLILGLPAVAKESPTEKRQKLMEAVRSMSADTQGSYILIGAPDNQVFPLEMVGGALMTDARRGVDQMRYVQEHSSEIMSSFVPGLGYGKLTFSERQCEGQSYIESSLTGPGASEKFKREVASMYGEKATFQVAALNDHHLIYTMADKGYGVCAASKALKTGRCIADNDAVKAALERMPRKCHVLALLDVGELSVTLPALVEATLGGQNPDLPFVAPAPTKREGAPTEVGPLIGWCASIEEGRITGRFSVAASDLPLIGESARCMAVRIADAVGKGAAGRTMTLPEPPKVPREQPRPRAPGRPRSAGGHRDGGS